MCTFQSERKCDLQGRRKGYFRITIVDKLAVYTSWKFSRDFIGSKRTAATDEIFVQ